jgi:hypothetical protein
VRKRDDAGNLTSRQRSAALALLCLLGACLNPRPEELPSDSALEESDQPGADRFAPSADNAEAAPTAAGAPNENPSDSINAAPAPQAPEPPSLAAPPADAGSSTDVELDAGLGEETAPDGG